MRSGCWAGHFLVIGNASSLFMGSPAKRELCQSATETPRERTAASHLEGIVETGEYRGALAAVADIYVAHDEGTRDAAKSHAVDFVELIERQRARAGEHPPHVDERRELYFDRGRDRIESDDIAA